MTHRLYHRYTDLANKNIMIKYKQQKMISTEKKSFLLLQLGG